MVPNTFAYLDRFDPLRIAQSLVHLTPTDRPLRMVTFDVFEVRSVPHDRTLVQLHMSIYDNYLSVYTLTKRGVSSGGPRGVRIRRARARPSSSAGRCTTGPIRRQTVTISMSSSKPAKSRGLRV